MTNLVHMFENTREIAHKPEVFVSNHEWELAVFIRFFFSFFFSEICLFKLSCSILEINVLNCGIVNHYVLI